MHILSAPGVDVVLLQVLVQALVASDCHGAHCSASQTPRPREETEIKSVHVCSRHINSVSLCERQCRNAAAGSVGVASKRPHVAAGRVLHPRGQILGNYRGHSSQRQIRGPQEKVRTRTVGSDLRDKARI